MRIRLVHPAWILPCAANESQISTMNMIMSPSIRIIKYLNTLTTFPSGPSQISPIDILPIGWKPLDSSAWDSSTCLWNGFWDLKQGKNFLIFDRCFRSCNSHIMMFRMMSMNSSITIATKGQSVKWSDNGGQKKSNTL